MSSPPPALPEEDYEAIEAAVMETARGRWFLAEFARRNRSADTTVLLAAIDRLEKLIEPGPGNAVSKPHEPVATGLATSASSELFAIDSQPIAPHIPMAGLPDDGDASWVIEDRVTPPALPKPLEIVEIDDADLIWPCADSTVEAENWKPEASEAAEAEAPAGTPSLEPDMDDLDSEVAPPTTQNLMLTSALAAAHDTVARASETPPPAPPGGISPNSVDPIVLDGLSFEEKIVYFA